MKVTDKAFMKISSVLTMILMLVGTTNIGYAESFKDKMIEEKFAAADKNHDGKLTLAEAKDGMPKVAANFDKIDIQGRGYVTLEQIKSASDR